MRSSSLDATTITKGAVLACLVIVRVKSQQNIGHQQDIGHQQEHRQDVLEAGHQHDTLKVEPIPSHIPSRSQSRTHQDTLTRLSKGEVPITYLESQKGSISPVVKQDALPPNTLVTPDGGTRSTCQIILTTRC